MNNSEYLECTISGLAETIGVSVATIYNWIKTKKINPISFDSTNIKISTSEFANLRKGILVLDEVKNHALSSRRNKTQVSGFSVYGKYVEKTSPNLKVVSKLLQNFTKSYTEVKDSYLRIVIANVAIQILNQNNRLPSIKDVGFIIDELSKDQVNVKDSILYLNNIGPEFYLIQELLQLDDLDNIEKLRFAYDDIKSSTDILDLDFKYVENEDTLGLVYMSLSNFGNKKKEGAYYTPITIVKKLIKQLFDETNSNPNLDVLDPGCGTGNFLINLPNYLSYKNVYGHDIDQMAINIARINIVIKYKVDNIEAIKEVCDNISCVNFLDKNIAINISKSNKSRNKVSGFDVILGNPPWGYKFKSQEKKYFFENYAIVNSVNGIESFALFIERSIEELKVNGKLCFVLPESILNVATHEELRSFILANTNIDFVNYLGDVFEGVACPCVILGVIKNSKLSIEDYKVYLEQKANNVDDASSKYTVSSMLTTQSITRAINNYRKPIYITLASNKTYEFTSYDLLTSKQFCFNVNDENAEIIRKIDSIDNVCFLKDNADFALGLVTGNNEKYVKTKDELLSNVDETFEVVLKGLDISKFEIISKNNYIDYKPEYFQQVSKECFYRAEEKLIYKFISNTLVFAYDNEKTLTLNSCNILIPKFEDISIKYILALLNSYVLDFYFKQVFNSSKVLRSHLEKLPLIKPTEVQQKNIIAEVDKFLEMKNAEDKEAQILKINQIIADMYGLSDFDYKIVFDTVNKKSKKTKKKN